MTWLHSLSVIFTALTLGVAVTLLLFTVVDVDVHTYTHTGTGRADAAAHLQMHMHLFSLSSFKYVVHSDICTPRHANNDVIDAIVLVTSHVNDVESRSAQRQAYSSDELTKLGVRRLFLLAQDGDLRQDHVPQKAILDENRRFHDIIQGNFLENYRNLTYKHIMGLQWVSEYCPQARYVIKMDVDIVVDMYRLMDLLKNIKYSKTLLMGYVLRNMIPVREPANKWFVTVQEYPKTKYPPFLSGWLYVTTPSTAQMLVKMSTKVKYFWIDDTYVTGILSKLAGVPLTDIGEHYTANAEYIECCLKDVGGPLFTCDYMVGPNGGNRKLLVAFQDYARKCYVAHCPRRTAQQLLKRTCVIPYKAKLSLHDGQGEAKPVQLF